MSATEAEVKLCEQKHKEVDRRLEALEADKRFRDSAGWKSFGSLILALFAAALSFYATVLSGRHP